MPPRKKIAPNQEHGFIGQTKSKPKPPKPYDDTWIRGMWYKRDMVMLGDMFVSEETKIKIRERYETTGKNN